METSVSTTAVPLYARETLDDLQRSGLRLIQKETRFRFGTASVLLAQEAARAVQAKRQRPLRVADLAAGCGAVGILLAGRLLQASITAFEKDPACCSARRRNLMLNGLNPRFTLIETDLGQQQGQKRPFEMIEPLPSFDLVVINPPFYPPQAHRKAAGMRRHQVQESSLSLSDWTAWSHKLLRPQGLVVAVHHPRRLVEVLAALRQAHLEPVTLRFVLANPDRRPCLFLIVARHLGRPGGLKVEASLCLFDENQTASTTLRQWYGQPSPLPFEKLWQGIEKQPITDPAEEA